MLGTTQTTVGTGNGTRRGKPPARMAGSKRKRRTKAQIALAQGAKLPAEPVTLAAKELPRDAVLTFADQTRNRMAALSPAEQIAAKAWLAAAFAKAA